MNYQSIVKKLLKAGGDVDIRNKGDRPDSGETPLHCAALWGRYEIAQLLIDAGANVNAQDDQGSTPLHEAARTGRVKLSQLLLDSGAKADARDDDGKTPLDRCREANGELDRLNAAKLEKILTARNQRE